jgi:hypothetical protein
VNNISLQYRFSDFILNNYKRLLQIAKDNYTFIMFHDLDGSKNKSIVWRHDVEFSVPIAIKMAKIEHALGLKTTWFFQVHGDFYNLLEKNTFDAVKQIQSLGHEIGLHFDAHFWDIKNEEELDKYLGIDKALFEDYFCITPKVFSFHNTNDFVLSCEREQYSGMLNVYSRRIKSQYGYCADSTGFWRYEILEDRLREAKDKILQVLIHDGMWQDEVLPPRRRVYKVIEEHAAFMKKSYDEKLKKFGAKNIDWEGEV